MKLASLIDLRCSTCESEGSGTYRTTANCPNCGWSGEALHSRGHEKHGCFAECPQCGCWRVQMGHAL